MLFSRIFKKVRPWFESNARLSDWGKAPLPPALTLLIYSKSLIKIYTVIWGNKLVSLKVIKITTFEINQFMTCYLIFYFRPTYFSYFQKIIAISICRNVKKLGDQKWSFPVVKGLNYLFTFLFLEIWIFSKTTFSIFYAEIHCKNSNN